MHGYDGVVVVTRDLPDDLALPLASGEPWWYWLGARPALDLVNTRRERWRRRVETLVTPSDLSRWLVAAGLTDRPMRVSREVLDEARELREAIDACVRAVVAGEPPPAAAVTLVDDWLVFAGSRPQLRLRNGAAVLGERPAADSARRALGMVALDAARMLGTPAERERIRLCASDTCSARFYDRSPAGARRWCSMQTCGNAAKARRHRERLREVAR
jgi:predicted RNA-binding Zn ribbon-like protein